MSAHGFHQRTQQIANLVSSLLSTSGYVNAAHMTKFITTDYAGRSGTYGNHVNKKQVQLEFVKARQKLVGINYSNTEDNKHII